jgi:hypothetical protein
VSNITRLVIGVLYSVISGVLLGLGLGSSGALMVVLIILGVYLALKSVTVLSEIPQRGVKGGKVLRKVTSKQQALKETIRLWDDLAIIGSHDKGEALRRLGIGYRHFECSCCEFAYNEATLQVDCKLCPIWPAKDGKTFFQCEAPGSPYKSWLSTDLGQARKIFAKEVANLARKNLKELSDHEEE